MLQTFTISGAVVRHINAKATFFQYESGAANGADESIKVRADGNDLGIYMPGDSIDLPSPAARWEIVATSAANVGRVRLGMGRINSNRIVGAVKVIDQSADKTSAGGQFWAVCNRAAAGAAVSIAGIRNAAGSRIVYIKRLIITSSTAGGVNLWTCTGDPTVNPANNAGAGVNKAIGQAASNAWAIRGEAASGIPTVGELPGVSGVGAVVLAANVGLEIPLTTPIRLAAGFGLAVSGGVVNRDVSVIVDFEEA